MDKDVSDIKTTAETAIIGGGAAGLAAAALLSRAGKRALIIEQNPRVGKKLLTTGNGRCNLGHSPLDMGKYHGGVDLARRVFNGWQGAEAFFARFGLICKTDAEGRLYPYSDTSASVLDALRLAADKVEILTETRCLDLDITPEKIGFALKTDKGVISARKVIIATGGAFALLQNAKRIKHGIVPPNPALCPIITDINLTRTLKGLRLNARCGIISNGKILKGERGTVQFNAGNLSGICIMNLSRFAIEAKNRGKLLISLDIAPDFTAEQLRGFIGKRSGYAKEDWLTGLFPKRVGVTLIKQAGGDTDKLVTLIKDWRFPITGVAGFDKAQITAGGVKTEELNPDLSSKLYSGLYVIGEAVDVDGDCGGYNLEWAWASAYQCAKGILRGEL